MSDRLPNPYMPGEPDAEPRAPDAAWIVRLWNGGEHRRALELSRELPEDELAVIREQCGPGWFELAGLYPVTAQAEAPVADKEPKKPQRRPSKKR